MDGEPTAVFTLDLPRFRRIMESIAHAIYFKEKGARFGGSWRVFSPDLASNNDLRDIPDEWRKFRASAGAIPFTPQATPEPTVFRRGVHTSDDGVHFAYAFQFYGGFNVYVWAAP